jgi:uncharacterized protein
MPPKPELYFNDYADVVSTGTAERLNKELEDFEKATSSQIVVAIYPKMQSDSSVEDYTVRVANSWKVGQAGKKNGAVLFVFVQDHKMFIQTGYGLEGALPDALCKRIVDEEIAPHFKQGDYDGGVIAGVEAMMAAAKGEYTGNGHTVGEGRQQGAEGFIENNWVGILVIVLFLLFTLTRSGRRGYWGGWMLGSSGFGGWSGGGGGGGFGGGGGGGGGFSGGGGSFGGGGAGGSW